jgi:hypothetical protein
MLVTDQNEKSRAHLWKPGQSGNPTGIKSNWRCREMFDAIVAEHGGIEALSAFEQIMLLRGCRLLVRSSRQKDPVAIARLTGEARRLISIVERRTPSKIAAATPSLYERLEAARRAGEDAGVRYSRA